MEDFLEGLSPEEMKQIETQMGRMMLAGPDHPSIRNGSTIFTPASGKRQSTPLSETEEHLPATNL